MTAVLRPASLSDAEPVARLFALSRAILLPFLPKLHSAEEDLAFFRSTVLPKNSVFLLEDQGKIVAYCAFADGFLNHLYVHPDHQGEGHGGRLLALAKQKLGSFRLYCFQRNARARAFYERAGLVLEAMMDGSDNEEREPDCLYRFEDVMRRS